MDMSRTSSRKPAARHDGHNAGACETDAHLVRACLLNVSMSLPLLQSWPKGPRQRLTKTHLYFTGRLQCTRARPRHWGTKAIRQGRHARSRFLLRRRRYHTIRRNMIYTMIKDITGIAYHSILHCTISRAPRHLYKATSLRSRRPIRAVTSDFRGKILDCRRSALSQILIFEAGIRTAGRPVGRSAGRPVGRSAGRPVGRSAGRPVAARRARSRL